MIKQVEEVFEDLQNEDEEVRQTKFGQRLAFGAADVHRIVRWKLDRNGWYVI